jgi:hypothetical protein
MKVFARQERKETGVRGIPTGYPSPQSLALYYHGKTFRTEY